jgi:beta-galactosidase
MPTTPVSQCKLAYTVYGDGTVTTTLTYQPVEELKDMPEFGVMFKFDADYNQIEWYGYGPEENYCDRNKGAKLSIYHNKVEDNLSKYLLPQECGNKTGVRYAKVTDRKGRGMLFSGDEMNFSALPFTPHELENAAHPYELPQVHYTVVRVSKSQMGIAGDDAWGARTHEEYLLDVTKPMEFSLDFRGT